ncbi:MAG TPA: DsbA family oxidoreductase [Prolixibacteraceae bacterium]|nr:DsbA family oxidoreductase [Prolixibacteraceae bacterium]
MKKMTVEIWSDVMCPFCYIGKRRLEEALRSLPHKELVEVKWNSFQLYPNLEYDPQRDTFSHLAQIKGQTREWAVLVHNSLTHTARGMGLEYNFDKAQITDSFDAHRIIQLAKKYNRTDPMQERLFKAYFTEGELISDHPTLVRLAEEAGLPKEEAAQVLASDRYGAEVQRDAAEARRMGVNAVPFFVLNGQYAIVGAQDPQVFKETLQKAWEDWVKEKAMED